MATRTNNADGDATVMPASNADDRNNNTTMPSGSGGGTDNGSGDGSSAGQSASSPRPSSDDGNAPSANASSNPQTDANGDGSSSSGDGSSSSGGSSASGAGGGDMPANSMLDLGNDSPLQPALDLVTGFDGDLGGTLGSVSPASGITSHLMSAIGSDLGDSGITGPGASGASGLVGDALNLPGAILTGGLGNSLGHIGTDVANTVGPVVGAVDGLANTVLGSSEALAPVSNLLSDVTGNTDIPLVSADNGSAGNLGLADLNGASDGNLIDAGAGQSDNGAGVGLLSTPDSNGHAANVSAVDVGPDGPQLVSADIAPDGVATPTLNGVGAGNLGGLTASPLLTVNGGNNADDGGNAGATVGDLNGSSSGNLVHTDAGQADSNGTGIGVLTAPGGDHTADANAVDVGSDGPQLVDAGLLSDTGVPSVGDTGVPSLDGIAVPALGSTDGLSSDSSLLTVNGGNNADDGGVTGASLVNTNGSSSGNLIDADAGPNQSGNDVSILTTPGAGDHTATAGAVAVGPDGPQLADLGVLSSPDLINVTPLNGTGTDALTGSVLNTAGATADQPAAAPVPAVTDLVDTTGLVPGSIAGDHGVVDVSGHHII
jgi:hypothetical protein